MADDVEIADRQERAQLGSPTANLPLIITLVALVVFFSFQTWSLLSERSNLRFMKSNQDGALEEAQKVHAQFKILVSKTSELADQGHAGAKMIMESLQGQGVGFAPERSAPVKPAIEAAK